MLLHSLRAIACVFCLISVLAFAQSENGFNANQRIFRIRDLGKKNSQAIPSLAQYLSDPNRDIRIEAVKAIVKIETEASLDPLIKATPDNDPEVQIRATDGIVNFYVPGYVANGLTGPFTRGVRQVKSFFSSRDNQIIDPDVVVRSDVAEALGDVIRGGASIDSRANAARAAGILRARPAVPARVDSLHSKNSEVIFECLVALQKIDDASAGPNVPSLRETWTIDSIHRARNHGVLHSSSSAPDIRSVLRDARNVRIRRAALECLAMLGFRMIGNFQQYVTDRDAALRASALEGLGRIREPEDTPALERAYNEKNADPKVHLAAAFALVSEGKVDASVFSPLPYLVENLKYGAAQCGKGLSN